MYEDWHPPVMAVLWSAFIRAGATGTAPMLLLQLALFHGGIALAVAATGGTVRAQALRLVACWVVLAVPLSWMAEVIKDAQTAAALTMATGIVAWFRLRHGRVPPAAAAAAAMLLVYAMLLRQNAVFAVVPLAAALAGWGGVRSLAGRTLLLGAGVLIAIGASSAINHRVFDARPTRVERTLPLFDLAGIAHFAGLPTIPGLPAADWARAEARHCYTVFYWDSLGDADKCGTVAETLAFGDRTGDTIMRDWAAAIVAHPLAYARHRLGHWNTNLRFLVPWGEPVAAAPAGSEPNRYHIGLFRSAAMRWLAPVGQAAAASPLGWPVVWLAASAGLWWTAAGTARSPRRDMGLALGVSATLMILSFAVVSIASDLRYHLWSMIAATLGWMLLGLDGTPRRRVAGSAAGVAVVAAVAAAARLMLPPIDWFG